WNSILGKPRGEPVLHGYLGPQHSEADMEAALRAQNISFERLDGHALIERAAEWLNAGKVVGWYQGASEWGPRALGNRSILAHPRRNDMRDILNIKIKRREAFRPFAPSILEEETGNWFTIDYPDPFMLKVYPIRPEKRAQIPAVTHADGTGRLQTVSEITN